MTDTSYNPPSQEIDKAKTKKPKTKKSPPRKKSAKGKATKSKKSAVNTTPPKVKHSRPTDLPIGKSPVDIPDAVPSPKHKVEYSEHGKRQRFEPGSNGRVRKQPVPMISQYDKKPWTLAGALVWTAKAVAVIGCWLALGLVVGAVVAIDFDYLGGTGWFTTGVFFGVIALWCMIGSKWDAAQRHKNTLDAAQWHKNLHKAWLKTPAAAAQVSERDDERALAALVTSLEQKYNQEDTMNFSHWLDTFLDEKGIDLDTIVEAHGPSGKNLIPVDYLVDLMKQAPESEQQGIKETIIKIDSLNGDALHYFKHLAHAVAM